MSANLYRFKYDEYGNTKEIIVYASGAPARSCSYINKGTAFSLEERSSLNLDAMLPPGVRNLDDQLETTRVKVQEKVGDIEKYIFIRALFNRNATLAHALIKSDIDTYAKIIYTPTVGYAVQRYSSMFRQANGLHFYPGNIDRAEDILRRFAHRDIRVAVVTDNHGILGLGDQGAGGIAACLGKLMLYTQGAGIAPWHCLPISLDVGTDNEKLLADKQYLGWPQRRLKGEEYLSFIGRFVRAFRNVFPNALCQWEDFSPKIAFSINDAFCDELISFNDDIQGTGAVAAAALLSAMKIKEESLIDQRFLIHGAGCGGIGIAEQLTRNLKDRGLSEEEACQRIFIVDSGGLITRHKENDFHKKKFAKDKGLHPWIADLDPVDIPGIIREAGITVLIGTTGQDYFFNDDTVAEIKKNTDRPVILPLFHHVLAPELFCQNIGKWSEKGILIATGNPCSTSEMLESAYGISQCNNALIFPGVVLGILASGANEVLPEFFTVAAEQASALLSPEQLEEGNLMPPLRDIRAVAKKIALAVAMCAVEKGINRPCVYSDFQPGDDQARMARLIDKIRWKPEYLSLVPM
ncbi:oxaloacetate-decarboxylating malate dehydrogenase [Desulforhopalus singaporensis]|uniref:Malate dehydrogenase (Oxaloacetate-decarboxylating) n=1 Tax=Desulforhopalus singaporensis TaxID=91360 RepID=A0A1H0PEF1_9BACT|nr:oxaloacetate-decarboxylating malate dehydrogenase [Desulforhopalus singaporensis]SDP03472.1 malate dehydrogenase (oxaloacetate-decarboxylating) [Desulforhopalus singaporensis]